MLETVRFVTVPVTGHEAEMMRWLLKVDSALEVVTFTRDDGEWIRRTEEVESGEFVITTNDDREPQLTANEQGEVSLYEQEGSNNITSVELIELGSGVDVSYENSDGLTDASKTDDGFVLADAITMIEEGEGWIDDWRWSEDSEWVIVTGSYEIEPLI